ncbi:MAG: hypothetical protein QOF89_5504 [Acidobacteriota bacterium]|jgi:uncharacterized membrane protein|nr:hypothetical protein [Acidobacteriota bacterium]
MEQPAELSARATSESARKNIDAIVRLEEAAVRQRSLGERVSDAFTRVMGSMSFVAIHLVLFAVWCVVNLGLTPLRPFDPFPFGILTLIVSAEGVLLAIFVLVSQNRMSRQANQRAHLNLQINLLAEQESTKLLQKVQSLLDHFGIEPTAVDQVVERLSQETHVETLVNELQRSLPEE